VQRPTISKEKPSGSKKLTALELAEDESEWECEGEPIPDGDAQGELHGAELAQAERAAAARLGQAVCMGDVIERLIANASVRPRSQKAVALLRDQPADAEHYEG